MKAPAQYLYVETNYEFDTQTRVFQCADKSFLVVHVDLTSGNTIGDRLYDASCEREAVTYAKKLCAGEVCKGDFVTL